MISNKYSGTRVLWGVRIKRALRTNFTDICFIYHVYIKTKAYNLKVTLAWK